jgi:hypothetical protein
MTFDVLIKDISCYNLASRYVCYFIDDAQKDVSHTRTDIKISLSQDMFLLELKLTIHDYVVNTDYAIEECSGPVVARIQDDSWESLLLKIEHAIKIHEQEIQSGHSQVSCRS